MVSNRYFRVPDDPLVQQIVESDHFDAADDYIAVHAHAKSVVITADILLAERALERGTKPKGCSIYGKLYWNSQQHAQSWRSARGWNKWAALPHFRKKIARTFTIA